MIPSMSPHASERSYPIRGSTCCATALTTPYVDPGRRDHRGTDGLRSLWRVRDAAIRGFTATRAPSVAARTHRPTGLPARRAGCRAVQRRTGDGVRDLRRRRPVPPSSAIADPFTDPRPRHQEGSGIDGMTQRAALLGGSLETGHADGIWTVRAELPTRLGPDDTGTPVEARRGGARL